MHKKYLSMYYQVTIPNGRKMCKFMSLYLAKQASSEDKNVNKIRRQSNCNSFISKIVWNIIIGHQP